MVNAGTHVAMNRRCIGGMATSYRGTDLVRSGDRWRLHNVQERAMPAKQR
jgi:hypothetical protein